MIDAYSLMALAMFSNLRPVKNIYDHVKREIYSRRLIKNQQKKTQEDIVTKDLSTCRCTI